MKAIGFKEKGSIERDDALIDVDLPQPTATDYDLLVQVSAISVNPIDCKIRSNATVADGEVRILGWDAVGTVVGKGTLVQGFEVGDKVYYAGDVRRQGTNAEYSLIDARLAAKAPSSLSDGQAAALPLASLTAWEMLFERLEVLRPVSGANPAILILGAAGGVGSMAIQLLRARTDLTIIATASRPETQEWCTRLGADYVIDHTQALAPQIEALGLGTISYVFATAGVTQHSDDIAKILAPQGRFGFIDDAETINVNPFRWKSISIHLEAVFMRSLMQTADMNVQGEILRQVAELVDAGKIQTTATETLSPINAANLKQAHQMLENGQAVGKIVLEGF